MYEIDQSGKVENTAKDTILCLSNGSQYTVVIKAQTKRDLQQTFRGLGKPRDFVVFVFAALLAFIIAARKPVGIVTIDQEYMGKEDIIKLKLLQFLKVLEPSVDFNFCFGLVGKTSPAHELASWVAKKEKLPNKTMTYKEITRLIFSTKKDRVSRSGPRTA